MLTSNQGESRWRNSRKVTSLGKGHEKRRFRSFCPVCTSNSSFIVNFFHSLFSLTLHMHPFFAVHVLHATGAGQGGVCAVVQCQGPVIWQRAGTPRVLFFFKRAVWLWSWLRCLQLSLFSKSREMHTQNHSHPVNPYFDLFREAAFEKVGKK